MNPEEIPNWEPFLKRVPLFSGLSSEELGRVASKMQLLSLPKGAVLFSQGDEGDAFYIITSGQVRLVQTRRGQESVTALLGRGDAVGELGLLTGEARTVTVKLDTTCEFLKLIRKDFEEILRQNPSILLHLSRMISRRLVDTNAAVPAAEGAAPQLITLNAAAPRPDAQLLALHLGLQLLEQTRRRTLIVDMGPEPGAIARALGLKPQLATETAIRALDMNDRGALASIAQTHNSGLVILSLAPAVLGGRLYSGIYLLLNFLREAHDLVLVSFSNELGDVERSILAEADRVILAGTDSHRPQFRQLEAEVPPLAADYKKIFRLWLGDPDPEAGVFTFGPERMVLPWSEAVGEAFERSGSPFEAMESHPKSMAGVGRLARRLGKIQVGLALGTGAALGYSLIGVLKVFKREHIPIDLITGTSVGSVVAGFTALGMEPEEIEEIAVRIDKAWLYENLFWDITLPRTGFFAGQTLLRFLRSYLGGREFSDLEIPFACVATDIESGEEVVLKEGRVAEAVRASCGLPLIFSPLQIQGRYLVDGGLGHPVPTKAVADLGADILVAVNLTMPAGDRGRGRKSRAADGGGLLGLPVNLAGIKDFALPEALTAPSMIEVFFRMIYTMEYQIALSRADPAHVVIQPDLSGFSWTEMHRAKELISLGERIAEQYVPQIKSLIPYFADYCKVPIRTSGGF